ncbi:peptidoglycan-associated lipoprotein Pal [Sphaerotilus montanus]|uniref:Peptidoglycan-associated lipoprotein n=1 Tax=Sphaerotilus montanus TaxID=522889 RepID=A0A7Y9UL25_9BURK|nr:peptidoglycan-associated lipoprotein Pal [Sphaerotilus montanus]NYG34305.1 peptidoglycan-associated lipoprotein [Sphaerotilus montanus]NZD58563.1 peptidoglycan-associated lipoprotein Pal [Sphaerotilus montanus]
MQITKIAALILVANAALVGCSSAPVAQSLAKPEPTAIAATATPASAQTPVASLTVVPVTILPHLDPKSLISTERSVYFDFNVFTVKSEYTGLIERHGKYLSSKPALSIKIEGNADERGSSEYNLALGQKRAQSVLQTLKIHGVKDSQMEAISWGKERPKAMGHDEAAWAENRRADLVYPKQ